MSRIGKVPIVIPSGVQVSISPDVVVSVKGAKGELSVDTRRNVAVKSEDGKLIVERHSDQRQHRAYHGLYHRLITNAITGVTEGYRKELEIQGVGFKADMTGGELVMTLGWSHQVRYQPPAGVQVETPAPTKVVVTGIDKQAVHQAAAQIRAARPPEPYKGKGVRYLGEAVRRKVGKTGVK